jgi:hypothetical protein
MEFKLLHVISNFAKNKINNYNNKNNKKKTWKTSYSEKNEFYVWADDGPNTTGTQRQNPKFIEMFKIFVNIL